MTVLAQRARGVVPRTGDHGVLRLLTAAALALIATHWLRLLPLGFEAPGATRYEDFVDLLTPYVVLGPALAALAGVGASRRTWMVALLGAIAFTQGHGVHLSANSIRHARGPGAPVDLWDERVGHWIWFVGLALVVGVVAWAVRLEGARLRPAAVALSAVLGLTWAANVVEAGMVPLGALLALTLGALGWRLRAGATGRLLALAFGLSLLLMVAWGIWHGGFPQPSELGWLSRPLSRG